MSGIHSADQRLIEIDNFYISSIQKEVEGIFIPFFETRYYTDKTTIENIAQGWTSYHCAYCVSFINLQIKKLFGCFQNGGHFASCWVQHKLTISEIGRNKKEIENKIFGNSTQLYQRRYY
jgi:hypothetical protein